MNQRGFATLEVILMVMVIGILASIAVPRFTSVTTAANTAKVQADLSTIDTAIAVYHMEYGENTNPADVAALVTAGYLQAEPKPPKGYVYVKEETGDEPTSKAINKEKYETSTGQATLDSKTADKFYVPKKTTPTTPETTDGG